jgi:hypothetical protein
LIAAAMLFLGSLLLARRLSIQFAGSLEETPPHDLSVGAEPKEVTPTVLTTELLAA